MKDFLVASAVTFDVNERERVETRQTRHSGWLPKPLLDCDESGSEASADFGAKYHGEQHQQTQVN